MRRKEMIEALLEQFGVEKERFRLTWVSANEGDKFATIVKEMVEKLKMLGPFGGVRVGKELEQVEGGAAGV